MLNFQAAALKAKILTQKKAALVIAAVIVVLAVVVGILGMRGFLGRDDESGLRTPLAPVNDVLVVAQDYARGGDIDGGLAYYDSQIEHRKDANEKWQLLLYKSNFAAEAKRHTEAVEAAKRADDIKSDLSTAVALATAYEAAGDKQKALSYYKKALNISPKDGQGSRQNYMWEQKIQELQG